MGDPVQGPSTQDGETGLVSIKIPVSSALMLTLQEWFPRTENSNSYPSCSTFSNFAQKGAQALMVAPLAFPEGSECLQILEGPCRQRVSRSNYRTNAQRDALLKMAF